MGHLFRLIQTKVVQENTWVGKVYRKSFIIFLVFKAFQQDKMRDLKSIRSSILPAAGSARPFYFIEEKTDCIAVVAAEAAAAASSQQRIPAPSSFPLQAVFFRRYKLRPPSLPPTSALLREGDNLDNFSQRGRKT